jgi:hypothetical protein
MDASVDLPIRSTPLRFAIGDPAGRSSNSWRVWVERDSSVYIKCRDNYSELKVSLPYEWRMALTSEAIRARPELTAGGQDRAWERWDPPAVILPGVISAIRLQFIYSELAVTPELRKAKLWRETQFVEPAPNSDITLANIFISDREQLLQARDATIWLASLQIPDGRFVEVTLHGMRFSETLRQVMGDAIRESRRVVAEQGIEPPPTGRTFFFGYQSDGTRLIFEANYHRPSPDPLLNP